MKKKILMLAFVMLTLAVFVGCALLEQADTLTFTELPQTVYEIENNTPLTIQMKVAIITGSTSYNATITIKDDKVDITGNDIEVLSNLGFEIEVLGEKLCSVGQHNAIILLKVGEEVKATLNYSYTVVDADSSVFAGGNGSVETPYIVSTPAQLMLIGTTTEYESAAFILANDIDFTGYTYVENRTANFSGILDGNNYSIINYAWSKPMFDDIGAEGKETVIKNLHFKNYQYTAYDNKIAGVFGYNTIGKVTFENITIDKNSKVNNAGFVMYIEGKNANVTFKNCTNNAEIYAEDASAGGFVSRINKTATFINCVNNGKIISAHRAAAGFVGDNMSSSIVFNACTNNGNIYGGHRYGEGDENEFYNGFFVGRNNKNLTFVNTNTNTGNIYKREADESYVNIKDDNFINKGEVVEEYKKIDDLIFDEITFKPVALADKNKLSKSITINTDYLPANTKYFIVTYSGGYGSSRNQIDSKVFVLNGLESYTYTFEGDIPEIKNGKNFGDEGVCYIKFSISAYDENGEFLGSKMTNA